MKSRHLLSEVAVGDTGNTTVPAWPPRRETHSPQRPRRRRSDLAAGIWIGFTAGYFVAAVVASRVWAR